MHKKEGKWIWLILIMVCLLAASFAEAKDKPLPVNRAFEFSASFNGPNEVLAKWRIAPGYYLYANRLRISLEPTDTYDIRIPKGELKYDKTHGNYEVFSGLISVPVSLRNNQSPKQLNVDYQGCSQAGFCYPPIHKTVSLNAVLLTTQLSGETNLLANPNLMQQPSFQTLLTNQNGVQALLASQQLFTLMLIFLGLGLLLAFTPCVLPMVPILASIIAGQKQTTHTRKAFLLSSTYVLGTAVTYALAGMAAALMGHSLQVWLQKPWMIVIMSGLFVLLACSLFGLFDLRMPNYLHQRINSFSNRLHGGTYFGVFLMGVLSTLIVSPCITAPLVGVLMYIGETGSVALGASLLFIMAIGMGIPLILIGMSAGKWLPKSGPWMNVVKQFFGFMMLGMAIWLLSRMMPSIWIKIFWALLVLIIGLFFIVYLPKIIGNHRLNRGLGFLVVCGGFVVMTNGMSFANIDSFWQNHKAVTFTIVHNAADLDKKLTDAHLAQKPVILDFYADWCASCVAMDKQVFNLPEVKQTLTNYVLLRADLTENSAADEELLKKYSVLAPPTVLLFNAQGEEIQSGRIVGEVDAKEFLNRISVTKIANQCGKNKEINC